MSPTIQSLGIDKLSLEQRLALVQEIWDTIASDSTQSLLTDARRQELQKRITEDDSDPENVVPWEQVREETLARLKPQ